jgi:hypothetical protein
MRDSQNHPSGLISDIRSFRKTKDLSQGGASSPMRSVKTPRTCRTSPKQGGRESLKLKIVQSLPKSTKAPRTIVPPPQSQRIMQRFVAGQSIREISRQEGKARETVTKIVRSDEMSAFVRQMRESFYGLGVDALDAVRHSLCQKKDGQLGYKLLTDIGIIPPSEERQSLSVVSPSPEKGRDERVTELVRRLTEGARERARIFGMPMPENETVVDSQDVRRWLSLASDADEQPQLKS